MSGAPRHPDFQPGNTAALVHGAYSERAIAAKCDELSPGFAEWVAKRAAWAARPEFGPARINLLRASALVEMLYDDVIDTATARGSAAVRLAGSTRSSRRYGVERDALAQLGLMPSTAAELAQRLASAATSEALLDTVSEAGRRARLARSEVIDAEPVPDEEIDP